MQGKGASTAIVVDQLFQPPGSATVPKTLAYSRSAEPLFDWSAASGRWGPITYTVTVDGAQVAQTGASSFRVPAALANGVHRWQVTATNPAGVATASKVARVFVDTVAPLLSVSASGPRRAGVAEVLRLRYRDAPPPGSRPSAASGVAKLTIRWGDGTVTHLKPGEHRISHAYRRPGRYTITVTVFDRAGNQRTVVRHVKIRAARAL